jgi:glycosyltransferase involved in cell wall biosynthesis
VRIALFPSAFHPHFGGVEELTRQLAHAYRGLGHDVAIVTNRWPPDLPSTEIFEDLPIFRIPMRTPDEGIKPKINFALTHHSIVRSLCRDLAPLQPEVVHVQCVSGNGLYARILAERTGVPLIITAQGELTMDATGLYQRSQSARDILHDCLASAAAVTACSCQTLEELRQFNGGRFQCPAQTVYNGIKLDEFRNSDRTDQSDRTHPTDSTDSTDTTDPARPPHRTNPPRTPNLRPFILGVGRHVRQKGFDVLLKAFALTMERGNTAYDLMLAGDGPEHAALRELAEQLSISQRVVFTGKVDHREAVNLFSGCSFFVLPSRHEPFGIVNLEAMAAGRPVIATRTGGVPEIVREGENGLLVNSEQPEEMATAILRLISDGPLRAEMGTAGRSFSERFDWVEIAKQYLTIYEKAIEDYRRRDRT